jgi:uncharacterized membrane protein YGL010W
LLAEAVIVYEFAEARKESDLAQVMSLVLLGDYSSFYLAMRAEAGLSLCPVVYLKRVR